MIRFCGYMTQDGLLERNARRAIEQYAPTILGDLCGKVKEFRIIGSHHKIRWDIGYHRLWRGDGIARIHLPHGYNDNPYRNRDDPWLVIHELCHLKQLLSGQMKLRIHGLRYPALGLTYKGRRYHIHNFRWIRSHTGRRASPWEADIKLKAAKQRTLSYREDK